MNRIKELRKQHHLTLRELSEKVGISYNAINMYENEVRSPKLEIWQKLADYFNVPVSYLQGQSELQSTDYEKVFALAKKHSKKVAMVPFKTQADLQEPITEFIKKGRAFIFTSTGYNITSREEPSKNTYCNVLEVVNWLRFVNKAELRSNVAAEELTVLKAMELLYYIQAYNLVFNNKRLFNENIFYNFRIPVINKVYAQYGSQCNLGITKDIEEFASFDYAKLEKNKKTADVLHKIYKMYGHRSAFEMQEQISKELLNLDNSKVSDKLLKQTYAKVFEKE